jgi:hypothetical protein
MKIQSSIVVHFHIPKWMLKLYCLFFFSLLVFSLKASSPANSDSLNIPIATEEPSEEKAQGWYSTSLYAAFGMPKVNHSYASLVYDDTFTYGAGIIFNFRFVNSFGAQLGAGLTSQKIKTGLDEYSDQYMTVDSEGDSYQKIIRAQNVKEEQTWLWFNVPVALTYYQNLGKIEFYGFGGIEMRHALTADYKQSGTFTHQGYYERWNILFDDLGKLGFYTDRPMKVEDKLEPDLLIVPFVGIGMLAPGQKSRFYMEARYCLKSNDPFADKKQRSLFPGPDNNQSINEFKSPSVMSYGDVTFGGVIFILGINF